MTSLRRSLLDGVGGALLIIALSGTGCQSHTAAEQIGKLSREDTIAFLVLNDQLYEFRDAPADTVLCVAVETSTKSEGDHFDPSNALMARLHDTHKPGASNIVLKRDSDCRQNNSEWIDNASGRRAFIISVGRARESQFVSKDCGQYVGGWHGGALYGGGNYYAVEEVSGTISVSRTNCRFAE